MNHHPLSSVFPMMGHEELSMLAEDIKNNGLHEPCVVLDGKILDGRNRHEACKLVGVKPRFEDFNEKTNPLDFVISKNLKRRHLTSPQKALAAFRYKVELDALNGKRINEKIPGVKRKGFNTITAAKLFGVGVNQVEQVKLLYKKDRALFDKIDSGSLAVGTAFKMYCGRTSPVGGKGKYVLPRNVYMASDMDAVAMIHKLCTLPGPDSGWSFDLRLNNGMYNAHLHGKNGVKPLDYWPTLSGHSTLRAAIAAAILKMKQSINEGVKLEH